MLNPRSFDVYKNTAVLMIVILGCLEVNTEVSDIGIETAESDGYREVLEDNGNTKNILTIIQEGARFSHKDG